MNIESAVNFLRIWKSDKNNVLGRRFVLADLFNLQLLGLNRSKNYVFLNMWVQNMFVVEWNCEKWCRTYNWHF